MTLNDYAQTICFWAGDNELGEGGQPVKWSKLPEILRLVESRIGTANAGQRFAIAGVVLALESQRPELFPSIRATHRHLYREIGLVMECNGVQEWADFHVAQWLITNDPLCIDKVLDQAANGGDAGHYASAALAALSQKWKPFEVAIDKAREARRAAMVIQ